MMATGSRTPEQAPEADETKPADGDQAAEGVRDDVPDESSSPFAQFYSRTDTTITITFRKRKFIVPRLRGKWPTRAMQIFQRGQMGLFPDAVELMLGASQWDTFNDVAPLIDDFWEFLPIFAEAVGLQPVADSDGESK